MPYADLTCEAARISHRNTARKWRQNHPVECRAEKKKARNRKLAWLKSLRVRCIECGMQDPRCLEFHHRDPSTKLFCVTEMTNKSWSALQNEVEKCDIMCANCHCRKTR